MFLILVIRVADLGDTTGGAGELDFDFYRRPARDRTGISPEIAKINGRADGIAEAARAHCEVESIVGADCLRCDALEIDCIDIGHVARVGNLDFRRHKAARACLDVNTDRLPRA